MLTLLDPEDLCPADRAHTLDGWLPVFEDDALRFLYLPLGTALHAVSFSHINPPSQATPSGLARSTPCGLLHLGKIPTSSRGTPASAINGSVQAVKPSSTKLSPFLRFAPRERLPSSMLLEPELADGFLGPEILAESACGGTAPMLQPIVATLGLFPILPRIAGFPEKACGGLPHPCRLCRPPAPSPLDAGGSSMPKMHLCRPDLGYGEAEPVEKSVEIAQILAGSPQTVLEKLHSLCSPFRACSAGLERPVELFPFSV